MPDQEIDDHQTDVELEVLSIAHPPRHFIQRPEHEMLDLAVRIARHEAFFDLKIIEKQRVRLQPSRIFHQVRHDAHRHRPPSRLRRQARLLVRFFHQVLIKRQPDRLTAGDQIIQLARCDLAVRRPLADPEMNPVSPPDKPVDVKPEGHDPEMSHGGPVDLQQRRLAPRSHNRIVFTTKLRNDPVSDQRVKHPRHGLSSET